MAQETLQEEDTATELPSCSYSTSWLERVELESAETQRFLNEAENRRIRQRTDRLAQKRVLDETGLNNKGQTYWENDAMGVMAKAVMDHQTYSIVKKEKNEAVEEYRRWQTNAGGPHQRA